MIIEQNIETSQFVTGIVYTTSCPANIFHQKNIKSYPETGFEPVSATSVAPTTIARTTVQLHENYSSKTQI
jgi:hypothetical protein